jgi:hypothetical protein
LIDALAAFGAALQMAIGVAPRRRGQLAVEVTHPMF